MFTVRSDGAVLLSRVLTWTLLCFTDWVVAGRLDRLGSCAICKETAAPRALSGYPFLARPRAGAAHLAILAIAEVRYVLAGAPRDEGERRAGAASEHFSVPKTSPLIAQS